MHFRTTILTFLITVILNNACSSQNRKYMEDHPHTNALINETSPYLLQHAHNPVHWYPWGEAALEKAKQEDKLIIISIGYSSCHWCHVMEHESFEDSIVAQLMNEHFVSIKVDREERPDIDHIYMTAVQMLNQQGGWPLNCIAIPDGKPIWGGTYFPKENWIDALSQVHKYYQENPEKTRQYAAELAEGIRQRSIFQVENQEQILTHEKIHRTVKKWSGQFDDEYGGQKGAPKFPLPVNLEFLLHYGNQYGDQEMLDHVDLTLTSMARGGIYDQAGGGFARYSVDPIWKVPHFEKMLYDNAQLIKLYSRAYQLFGKETYAQVIRQSIEFTQREMLSPEGAFFSALDADSEGEEGKYYVWDKAELEDLLGGDLELFSEYYNINATGLWEHNRYILFRTSDPETFAAERGLELQWFSEKIIQWNEILLIARNKRIPPGLDDKSLTSWGSMMISGLVQAYDALGDPQYLDLATTSAHLIREKLWSEDRILYRNYKNGRRSIPAFHIDYALYIEACLDLYSSSLDQEWLDLASDLTGATMEQFYDQSTEMFNYNGKNSEILIANNVETQDNVIPSSNSVMAHNLFRLGHLLVKREYLELSASMMKQMQERFDQYPHGFANWGRLILMNLNPFYEIVVVGPSARSKLGFITTEYLPHALVVGSTSPSTLPLFQNRFEGERTSIFVCRDNVCQLPVEEPEEAKKIYHIQF
jgi:uncharacterized protein YyaL (SSP411 family)